MSALPEVAAEAAEWIRYAMEDLADADASLAHGFTSRNVCWLALQAVEKVFKAVLVFESVSFPKTHDLIRLLGLIDATWGIAIFQMDVAW